MSMKSADAAMIVRLPRIVGNRVLLKDKYLLLPLDHWNDTNRFYINKLNTHFTVTQQVCVPNVSNGLLFDSGILVEFSLNAFEEGW